ncbi:hypothetical protein HN371_22945 [Candidatus Poribacteria bacterium]|jgi:Zn-finger nucleic acid-binding protein|nr:hypothetical protein [Candidatus Poribacteria bacterium]MBT5532998.1 hypothetical protein [Candidatus Poribacteria bacterium]MBT5709961.1 hypothetical protein [Candidatus Poribacteria bacterium]MBT7097141.1 hypothetical protein [Candidatus Poribacteria bacterium]MBT7805476.1 hypothetical protein [Candidatus Poribacteria bacterium]
MRKLTPDGALTLDHCERCGGIWFDGGEAAVLGELRAGGFEWPAAPVLARAMPCQDCGAAVGRDAERCAVCGHANVVECPVCRAWMAIIVHRALRVDHCRQCRGFWFDAREIFALRAAMSSDWEAGAAWAALMLGSGPGGARKRRSKGRPDVIALLRSPSDDGVHWVAEGAAHVGVDVLVEIVLHVLFGMFE